MKAASNFDADGENRPDISHFEHLFPEGQEWFSPKEAGFIIGRSDQFVRNGVYNGRLMGHITGAVASSRGEEKKAYLRVHKSALMFYLLESANYTPEFFMQQLEHLIAQRSTYQLLRIERFVRSRLYGGANPRLKRGRM